MEDSDIRELADMLIDLGATSDLYNFLKEEGLRVQSYSTFSKKCREGYLKGAYRQDLIHLYIPEDSDKRRLLEKLR